MSRRMILILVVLVAVVGGGVAWLILSKPKLAEGFAAGNGRLEATEVYVSTKYPGRIAEMMFNEGDTVEAGQVVARMDTTALQAQLREAEAQIAAAQNSKQAALAQVSAKAAESAFAGKQYARSKELVSTGAVSQREAEADDAR